MNLPQMQKIMREFERESATMDMKDEMMGDAVDEAMDDDAEGVGEEEEGDAILKEVLDEIGVGLGQQVGKGRCQGQSRAHSTLSPSSLASWVRLPSEPWVPPPPHLQRGSRSVRAWAARAVAAAAGTLGRVTRMLSRRDWTAFGKTRACLYDDRDTIIRTYPLPLARLGAAVIDRAPDTPTEIITKSENSRHRLALPTHPTHPHTPLPRTGRQGE